MKLERILLWKGWWFNLPGSVVQGKEQIKQFVQKHLDIKKIVDVGAGSGTYRTLIGDGYEWTAIEIWEPYVERFNLTQLYKKIVIGNVFELFKINSFPSGDCIIFGDVLEHLVKEEALVVLQKALENYKHVIVSIPIGEWTAQEHYGNKYELHISTWSFKELEDLYEWKYKQFFGKNSIGVFCK